MVNTWRSLGIICCLIGTSLSTGHARHTDESRITDGTANTLRDREIRLGLYTAEMGIGGSIEFGVSPILWLLKVSNVFVKARVNSSRTNLFALSAGAYGINLRDLSDQNPDALLYVINAGVHYTRRLEKLSLSLGAIFARVGLTDIAAGSDVDLRGVVNGTTGLIRPTAQWRLSKTTALVLEAQLRLFQTIQADAKFQDRLNSRVTVDTYAGGSIKMDEGMPANITAAFQWSYDHFNLKLGLQHGYFAVPLAGFFIEAQKITIPVIDLYWRF